MRRVLSCLEIRDEHYSSSNSIDPTDHSQSEKGDQDIQFNQSVKGASPVAGTAKER